LGAISHETRNETHGERERTTASSPRAKIEVGDGCPRGGGRRNPATSERRLLGPPVRERGEIGAGQQGRTRGARLPFNEAEGHEGGRSHDARALNGGSALTGSGRGTRGGGRRCWQAGPGWQRQWRGRRLRLVARLARRRRFHPNWAGPGRKRGRGKGESERAGSGRKNGAGPKVKKGRGGKGNSFSFSK